MNTSFAPITAFLFLAGALAVSVPVHAVVLNEIMAGNANGIRDEDGDQSDWIELYNGSDEPVNLEGWFLTDDVLNPTQWRFPAVAVPASGYLLIWASGKDRTNTLHANFRLGLGGEYLALLDPATNVVSAFAPSFPRQAQDISYGRDPTDPALVGFCTNATPGRPNAVSEEGLLPEVQFSRSSSTFVDPFELTLSVANTNADIRYLIVTNRMSATNMGFLSVTNLLHYTGPIMIRGSWQVRARAIPKEGASFYPSRFRSESYIQLNPNVLNFSSDLPLVIIHDFGAGPYDQSETKREETSVVAVFEPGTDRSSLTNHPVLVSRARINARGGELLGYAKVSLSVELWNELDDDADKPVLGMKPESDWVFYAPNNFEPVLFHNPLYYQLSRDVGRWAPETRFAEVFFNTSTNAVATNHYNGIYVVTEKIKRSPNRVNIPRLDLEDTNVPAITGGYLLSIGLLHPGEATFTTAGFPAVNMAAQPLIYTDPSGRNGMNNSVAGPRDAQERYIANYLNTMATNLASATYTNVPKIYEQHIDVDSWIDHVQIAMAAFNVEAIRWDGFLYKDRDKRIEFGPVWDCDRCMGSTDGRNLQPRTWTGTGDRTDFFNVGASFANPWYQRLFRDLDFWQKYVDRYQELRAGAFHLTNIFARIDQNVALLTNAYLREFNRWRQAPRRHTANANGNYTLTTGGATYDTEVQWKKEWFSARFNFLDTNHLDRPQLSFIGMTSAGTTVTITPAAKAGSYVIYTLDGTDPRAPHGRIAGNAFSNLGPITITVSNNARIVARSFNPAHRNMTGPNLPPLSTPWSGPISGAYDPVIVVQPIGAEVAPGADYILSVQVTNTATLPVGYRWRRNGTTVISNALNSHVGFLLVTNILASNLWDVIVNNVSQPGGIQSTRVAVKPALDTDGDGLLDVMEIALGLDPNDPADAGMDSDGDGLTNQEEAIAGTDPGNAASYFKVSRISGGGNAVIEFAAVAGRTYTVQYGDAPGNPAAWETLANLAARSADYVAAVTDPNTPAARIYRLVTPASISP